MRFTAATCSAVYGFPSELVDARRCAPPPPPPALAAPALAALGAEPVDARRGGGGGAAAPSSASSAAFISRSTCALSAATPGSSWSERLFAKNLTAFAESPRLSAFLPISRHFSASSRFSMPILAAATRAALDLRSLLAARAFGAWRFRVGGGFCQGGFLNPLG